jgi:hypothetical protein
MLICKGYNKGLLTFSVWLWNMMWTYFIEAQVYSEKIEFGDGYWIEHKNEEKSNLICKAQNMVYF